MKTTPSVLVVDDEPDHCRNLEDIPGEFDYRVDTAPDGRTALERLETYSYDAAVLELVMPAMDGLRLLRCIKLRRLRLAACFVMADTAVALADAVRASRAAPMIGKPLDIPPLLDWVNRAVGRGKRLRESGSTETSA